MTISAGAALIAIICFAAGAVWAGVMDLATMKIRNELVLFLLAIYAALAPLAGLGAVQIGWSAAAALVVLAGMFVFFGLGWIGGGDAKLIAVMVLWLGAEQALPYVLYIAAFGGVLGLLLLSFRRFPLPALCARVPWIVQLHSRDSGIPYGIAISAAALFMFPNTPWITVLS